MRYRSTLDVLLCVVLLLGTITCARSNTENATEEAHRLHFLRHHLVGDSYKYFETETAKHFPHFNSVNASCDKVVFDIGFNNGADTRFFLNQNMCVVGVDANPLLIEEGLKAFKSEIDKGRLALFSVGLGEVMGNLTFYIGWASIQSSFNKKKVMCISDPGDCKESRVRKSEVVPVYPCAGLWALGKPYIVKIDIEELHYVCVEAVVRHVPKALRPTFISWEIHEFARGLKFPVLDTTLIGELAVYAGYSMVKVVSQTTSKSEKHDGGAESVPELPDDITNFLTKSSSWSPVHSLFLQGVPNARALGTWWDFHLKLGAKE